MKTPSNKNIQHIYWEKILLWLPHFISGIAIFIFFWWLAKVTNRLILRLFDKTHIEIQHQIFFAQLAKIILLIIGGISALSAMGVDTTTLITSLGIGGFALGFAMKDIACNILSGLLIIIYKPFKVGSQLSIGAFTGCIQTINLRYTVITTDEECILIPNAKILTEIIRLKTINS